MPAHTAATRPDELTALADLGRDLIGAQLDLHRLADLVYQHASHIVDTQLFQLGIFNGDVYRLLIWVVDGQRQPLTEFRLTPASQGIVGWLRRSRHPLLVNDFTAEQASLPARPRYISTNPPRSAIFVPLQVAEEVIGAIAIQSRQPYAFTQDDLRLLTLIANLVAAALHHGRLYEQSQRRATQLQLLAEISQRINVLQPLPDLYQQMLHLVAQRFAEYRLSLYQYHAEAVTLSAFTHADPPPIERFEMGQGAVGQAALTRDVALVLSLPDFEAADALGVADLGVLAVTTPMELAVPLDINGQMLGVLRVQAESSTAFDEAALDLFKSLAAQMAFAALEAQVYAQEQRRAEQLDALAQVARMVVSNLELEDVLDDVLDLVEARFGYAHARIFLVEDDHLTLKATRQRLHTPHITYPLDAPGLVTQVARTQQARLVDDLATFPNLGPALLWPNSRSALVAPLVVAGRTLGVFDVRADTPHAFTQDDVQVVQALADSLAIAVRNARLFESERRRRRLAEILREVSTALTSALSLDDVFAVVLDGLARVVAYDTASFILKNDLNELVLSAVRGLDGADLLGEAAELPLFESNPPATVDLAALGAMPAYNDLLCHPDEPRFALAALLLINGAHVGYLAVDRQSAPFAVEEVELVSAFASQAAVGIDNANLYTAQREQAWVSAALLQVAEAMARAPELDEVMTTVAELTPLLVGVEQCAIWLAEDDLFFLRAYSGGGALTLSLSASDWPALQTMLDAQTAVVLEPGDPMPDDLRAHFTGVVILLPLLAKGVALGMMLVGQTPGTMPFTTHRIRLISGIANQAALAIESALLDQAKQEEAWVSAALLQVAEAVASQATLDDSLQTVARLIPLLVGVDKLAIYQWQADHNRFVPRQALGVAAAEAHAALRQLALSPADLGLHSADTASQMFPLPEPLAVALSSAIGLIWPLRARGDLLGALVIAHTPYLGERRLNLLNGIAHQLAMAMESERLAREVLEQQRLEREIELGRDIQASFLPSECPSGPNWQLSALWRAARQVSGDFYDFIALRPRDGHPRWGIVIADVSDKGVPAALFMALSRTLIRSAAISRVSPATTLTRVNARLFADVRSEQFVTVFYAVWEPDTRLLTYANGGHNPPLLASAAGSIRPLPGRNMALGVLEDAEYTERTVKLEPGDVLLLYTDGLTDAINQQGEEFGLHGVQAALASARHEPGPVIVQRLSEAVEHFTGPVEAFDDLTLVALKVV